MNFSNVSKGILHNKYVLYFVFIIALMNLLYETVKQDYLYCALFVLIGFLTAFFNKNMIVILVITLASSAIIRAVIRGQGGVEGFVGEEAAESDAAGSKKDVTDNNSAASTPAKNVEPKKDSTTPSTTNANVIGASLNAPTSGVMGSTLSKSALIEQVKSNAVELMTVQNSIINGFQTIEPHMDRAEALIESIQDTAQTIQNMKTQEQMSARQGFKSK